MATAISGYIYDLQYGYTQYLGLRQENEELRDENAQLRSLGINTIESGKAARNGFECIPAIAISSSYNREKNAIIINKGSSSGIEKESGVIGPKGVVGIVHSVSENYSAILPLIHSDSKISGRLKWTNYFGQCRWDGDDDQYLILENIPNHVTFYEGDTIITRGGGGVFPPGLLIGFAETSERDESSGFQEIRVKLATNFRNLNSLYVIVNERKPELDSLIQATEEWTE